MKPDQKKLRLLIDDNSVTMKSAFQLPNAASVSQKIIEVSHAAITKSLAITLQNVLDLLNEAQPKSDRFEVTEMKFTLVFDATGEVSIASLVKGSLAGQTGLEFVIKNKEQK